MTNSLLAALVLLACACGDYQFGPPSPTPATGTVAGRVIAVPCAPVEKPGSACAGRPVPSLELDYLSGTSAAGRTVTDSHGNYSIELKPGAYEVTMKTYMRVISGPLKLSIAPGSNTVANYVLDNGIRVPVPQQ